MLLLQAGCSYDLSGYNGTALSTSYRPQLLVALALLVFAFGSLHPFLDAADLCGLGGCPEPSQSSHVSHSGGSSTTCVAAVLAAAVTTPAFRRFSKRRWVTGLRRPTDSYLSPDTPPPQVSSSR